MATGQQHFERLIYHLRRAETAAEELGVALGDSRWVAVVAQLDKMVRIVEELRNARAAIEVLDIFNRAKR